MWHRSGGVVVTAPVAQTVDEQDWSTLGLELFPHAIDETDLLETATHVHVERRRVVRELEPGDGSTVFVRQGPDGMLNVTIDPSEGSTPARAWVVRVNLRPGHAVRTAVADGVALASDALAVLTPVTSSSEQERFFPLLGAGTPPPSEAGDVAEVRLPSATGKRSLQLQLIATQQTQM